MSLTAEDGTPIRPPPSRSNPVRPAGNLRRHGAAPVPKKPDVPETRPADMIVRADRALLDWVASRRDLELSDAIVFTDLVSAGPSVEDEKVADVAVGNEGGGCH